MEGTMPSPDKAVEHNADKLKEQVAGKDEKKQPFVPPKLVKRGDLATVTGQDGLCVGFSPLPG
jgi:hypothetical protein